MSFEFHIPDVMQMRGLYGLPCPLSGNSSVVCRLRDVVNHRFFPALWTIRGKR